ncbi:MAG: hypothetical protein RLZZ244_1976 [Verrucomicrobiota bacterium]
MVDLGVSQYPVRVFGGSDFPPPLLMMRSFNRNRNGVCAVFVLLRTGWWAGAGWFVGAGGAEAAVPDFNREVRPILSDKCYYCHGPDEEKRKGKLRLDTPEGAAKALDRAQWQKSELLSRIESTDPEEQMPPPKGNIDKKLSAKEVATLKAWVAGGAPYAKHWAFVPPAKAPLPVGFEGRHPVDAFVGARLKAEGLSMSGPASKEALGRRVFLDLTGLPPTPEEVRAFVEDPAPGAYERLVDRVLELPGYGERMALLWMDLARYGDSSVYHADGPREMWGWRDGVIQAFQSNLPFDQFTVEQLAGDLLPDASAAQKIATGFNRNHATTDEGGVIAEEFRVDYVVDRVKTASNVWLGLSLECAQCHDHKYDPISQTEYYRFYAYFNNTRDPGMQTRNGNTAPLVEIPDPDAAENQRRAAEEVRGVQERLKRAREERVKSKAFAEWLRAKPEATVGGLGYPVAGVRFHVPCLDVDRTRTLAALDGTLGRTGALRLMRSKPEVKGGAQERRPGSGGLRWEGNGTARWAEGTPYAGAEPMSFGAWVRLPEKAGASTLLAWAGKDSKGPGVEFGFEGRRPWMRVGQEGSGGQIQVVAAGEWEGDQWHHVVVTYDGSLKASGVRFYVDGVPQEAKVEKDQLVAKPEGVWHLELGGRGQLRRFKGDVSAVTLWSRVLDPAEVPAAQGEYVEALRGMDEAARTPEQRTALEVGYGIWKADGDSGRREEYAKALEVQEKVSKGLSSVMVMEELPEKQMRATYVLQRGQYDAPLKEREVQPGVPAVLPAPEAGVPGNRLGLARWLVQANHPLTSRVSVNRFWQMLFGEGLVSTSEDFGYQGELPTHPELLDWLAVDFVESGWNVKALLKKILLSDTYRQESRVSRELLERDPQNRLLARGPRFRLQAEFIRDGALRVAGLLNAKVGGPSVRPYQPKGIWEEVAIDTSLSKFVQDSGERLYRRSMYTFWKRSSPHPSMVTFDATTREKCTGRRSRTNTPLQALVTLNDPQFVEASRALAQRTLLEAGNSPSERIAHLLRLTLGRAPQGSELRLLGELAEASRVQFEKEPAKAAGLLSIGESVRDSRISETEHAAWTVVANTVLNLDEFLVKP